MNWVVEEIACSTERTFAKARKQDSVAESKHFEASTGWS